MDLAKLHLHWGTSQYKGKRYRSYSLARAYRKNGKNVKDIVLKLGKLSEAEVAQWRQLLSLFKRPGAFVSTLEDITVTQHYAYLEVATANAIWAEWGLEAAFASDKKSTLGAATMARILTVNRCIDPMSKSQTPSWFQRTAMPWLLEIPAKAFTAVRVFRALSTIEAGKEALCRHLFTRLRQQQPETMDSVFYDLSSTTFSGTQCVLMKWGHCKEGYQQHVVLALVVNRDGLPFYWEVLAGGTADAKTITWLLEQVKARFQIAQTTVVFDRGMVSEANLAQFEGAHIKYISAMDKNQMEGLTGVDFTGFSHLDPERVEVQARHLPGFASLNEHTYYRETRTLSQRRYILCFNPDLFTQQRQARQQALMTFRTVVDRLNAELQAAKKTRHYPPTYDKFARPLGKLKLKAFTDVTLRVVSGVDPDRAIRTYQATVVVNESAMHHAGRCDGFWVLVTNHTEKVKDHFTLSASDAIKPYQEKVVIESAFRDLKSFVEVKPVHVWNPDHVKAHYTCCVLAHLINRTLTRRLHQAPGELTQTIVAHPTLYQALTSCQINRIEVDPLGLATYSMTRPTPEQNELMQRLGLTTLLSSDIVKKARATM